MDKKWCSESVLMLDDSESNDSSILSPSPLADPTSKINDDFTDLIKKAMKMPRGKAVSVLVVVLVFFSVLDGIHYIDLQAVKLKQAAKLDHWQNLCEIQMNFIINLMKMNDTNPNTNPRINEKCERLLDYIHDIRAVLNKKVKPKKEKLCTNNSYREMLLLNYTILLISIEQVFKMF